MICMHEKTGNNLHAFLNKSLLVYFKNLYGNSKNGQRDFGKKIRGLLHLLLDFKIFYKVTIEYGIGVNIDKKYRSIKQQRAQKYTHPHVIM